MGLTAILFALGAILALALILVLLNLRIVKQSEAWVMERFGVYVGTWQTGLHVKFPFIEKRRLKVDLREQVIYSDTADIDPDEVYYKKEVTNSVEEQVFSVREDRLTAADASDYRKRKHWGQLQTVITKDNVRVWVDTVIFYQITDCKLYVYGHARPIDAIKQLAATTLRNLIGELELDEVLTSRDTINARLRKALDEATDAWGIKVNRVELKNIVPPKGILETMEKQMTAERERRAAVIEAEGKRKSEILVAEGEKQSLILRAEGKAEAIRMINDAKPSQEYLTLKSLEALKELGAGESNTIIVPSEIQSLAGLTKSVGEVFKA